MITDENELPSQVNGNQRGATKHLQNAAQFVRRGLRTRNENIANISENVQNTKRSCLVQPTRRSVRLENKRLKSVTPKDVNMSVEEAKSEPVDDSRSAVRKSLIAKYTKNKTMLAEFAVPEADLNDKDIEVMMIDMAPIIFGNLEHIEHQLLGCIYGSHSTFLSKSQFITPRMREALCDWLIAVTSRLGLTNESLFMTITLVDLMLFKTPAKFSSDNFKILGITCVFISSKYEEIFPPSLDRILRYAHVQTSGGDNNAAMLNSIVNMEAFILQTLDMNIAFPYPLTFLRRFSRIHGCEDQTHNMAKYFTELMSVFSHLCHHLPSLKAAASLCAASLVQHVEEQSQRGININQRQNQRVVRSSHEFWPPFMEFHTGYTFDSLRPLMVDILQLAGKQFALTNTKNAFNKYSHSAFFSVSHNSLLQTTVVTELVQSWVPSSQNTIAL